MSNEKWPSESFVNATPVGRAPARPRLQGKRNRGSAEQVREQALEQHVELNQKEAIEMILNSAQDTFDAKVAELPDDVDINATEAGQALQHLKDLLEAIQTKVDGSDQLVEVTNEDGKAVQEAYNAIEVASVEIIKEPFDPESYAHEQFEAHGAVTASNRSHVYQLIREYKRGVEVGAESELEQLAEEIKDVVDELVGNTDNEETIVPEGAGVDLTKKQKESKTIKPEVLDDDVVYGEVLDKTAVIKNEDSLETVSDEESTEKHESDAMHMLYGMHMPDATSANYSIVSFREGLKVAIRHDPDLEQLPGKQELFNQVLTLLDYVPDGGLDQDTAATLKDLVEKINDPEYQVESSSHESVGTASLETDKTNEPQTEERNYSDELAAVLQEAGQHSLEPDIADEVSSMTPDFTPQSVSKKPGLAELASEKEKLTPDEQYVARIVADTEGLAKQGGWLDLFVGSDGKSPYEELADLPFEEVALWSKLEAFEKSDKIREYGISRSAFEAWMDRMPDMASYNVPTAHKTFKEVIDDYLLLRRDINLF